jgi:outer membrane protein OmpA-like peptidoglycan-associated protein
MRHLAGLVGLAVGLCVLGAEAAPPADTDTRSMIDALMPRTRSARNLLVRQKPEGAASAAAAASAASSPLAAASAPEPTASAPEAARVPVAAGPADTAAAPAGPPPSLSLAIQFEPNSAHVRPESGAMLGTLVAAMQSPELKGTRFIIEGHSDARGAPAQNQRLSQERADEVRLYLVALGVHPARLKAVGKGSSQPANGTDPQAAENRRVRVVTQE